MHARLLLIIVHSELNSIGHAIMAGSPISKPITMRTLHLIGFESILGKSERSLRFS